jgi:hypothetical protein
MTVGHLLLSLYVSLVLRKWLPNGKVLTERRFWAISENGQESIQRRDGFIRIEGNVTFLPISF